MLSSKKNSVILSEGRAAAVVEGPAVVSKERLFLNKALLSQQSAPERLSFDFRTAQPRASLTMKDLWGCPESIIVTFTSGTPSGRLF
jgi:hypothetical protein